MDTVANRICAKPEALSTELTRRVDAADRQFIRIRPVLVQRFPDEFNAAYWNATEDEWWWWPHRVPAELAHSTL